MELRRAVFSLYSCLLPFRGRSARAAGRSCQRPDPRGFTILELTIVVGLIVVLSVLTIPAFTSRKSGDDLTKAANTIKGVLDQARAYAQANNTYVWVGFYEENGGKPSASPPDPPIDGNGRLVMAVVASIDGTNLGAEPNGTGSPILDPTKLTQVMSIVKIDNVHLPLFAIPTGINCSTTPCDTFDTRPAIQDDGGVVGYNYSRFGELNSSPSAPATDTAFKFQYPVGTATPQYTFVKTLRFSPTGENRINSTYDVRRIVEIGLVPTHGADLPPGSGGTYPGNSAAVQIGGFNGDVKIYRR